MYGGAIRYMMPLPDLQSIIGVSGNNRAYFVTTDEYWLVCCSWVFQSTDTIGSEAAERTLSDVGEKASTQKCPHLATNVQASLGVGLCNGESQEAVVDQIVVIF